MGKHSRLNKCFWAMHWRCRKRPDYIKRGTRVCPEWQTYPPFKEWALSHGYRDDLTLDRIDNDGDYTPQNCRWATRLEQTLNRNCTSVLLKANMELWITLSPKFSRNDRAAISMRIHDGWDFHRAVTTPIRKLKKRTKNND